MASASVTEAIEFCRHAAHGHYSQCPVLYGDELSAGRAVLVETRQSGRLVAFSVARLVSRPFVRLRKAVISRGPVLDDVAALDAHLRELAQALHDRADWVAIDPYVMGAARDAAREIYAQSGFDTLPHLQDEYTLTAQVDVQQTDDALLRAMSVGHRRNIRKAAACGLAVSEDAMPTLAIEELLGSFSAARGLGDAAEGRLRALCRALREGSLAGRVLASLQDGRPAAAIVVIRCGVNAIFAAGGSADGQGEAAIPLTHLLHYRAMQWARDTRCLSYDLGGLWGDDPRGVAGIDRFKRGFGARPTTVGAAAAKALSPVRGRVIAAIVSRRAAHAEGAP